MAEETTSNGSVIPEVPAFNTENGGGVAATAPESIQPVKIEELSCTIGEKLAFTKFIKELRDMLAKHPGQEDICGDGQEDKNLSSCKKHPLLAKPRADQQPARWIRIKLQVVKENETWSTTLVMRDDNVDVMGFTNQKGNWYELGNSYKSILAARNVEEVMDGLVSAKLGKAFAENAVRMLSSYGMNAVDDGDNPNPRLAVVGLMFMVSESARMNPVHQAIARGWDDGTGFNRELMTNYVSKYVEMSSRLRQWKEKNYAGQRPHVELRAIYLVLNVEIGTPSMGDLGSSTDPKMSMAAVHVTDRLGRGHSPGVYSGKIATLIGDMRVGRETFSRDSEQQGTGDVQVTSYDVAVPYGSVLHIEVDRQIDTNNQRIKHLELLKFPNNNGTLSKTHEVDGHQVEVNISWSPEPRFDPTGEQEFISPPQPKRPVEVKMVSGHSTIVYTIGDAVSFTEFIMALRRILADHPGREDILDGHDLLNLSSTREHPLLAKPHAEQPDRWLHVRLQVMDGNEKTSWTTLLMRDDDLYVHGFINQKGDVFELLDNNRSSDHMLPDEYNPQRLEWTVEYKSMLEAEENDQVVDKLMRANLGYRFARDAVRVLSSYPAGPVADHIDLRPGIALAGLIVIVCESARMNPLHNSIAGAWSEGNGFNGQLMQLHVWNYTRMSKGLLSWKSRNYEDAKRLINSQLRSLQLGAVYLVRNIPPDLKKGRPARRPKGREAGNAGSGGGPASQPDEHRDAGSSGSTAGQPDEPRDGASSSGDSSRGNTTTTSGPAGQLTEGSSQPGKDGDSEGPSQQGDDAGDVEGHGRPRVELLALAIRRDFLVVGMKIVVFDGKRGQIIYMKKDNGEQEEDKEQQGEEGMVKLVLAGPYTGISAEYGCFAIKIDIPRMPSSGSGDKHHSIKWEWDCDEPKYAAQVDTLQPAHHIINAQDGSKVADVTYAVMSDAREATVQVKFRLKDGNNAVVVGGEITAHIDSFEDKRSILFRRAKGTGQCFSPTGDGSWFLLELARNVVAVPSDQVLDIEVNLQVETDDSKRTEVKARLRFDNGICSSKTDDVKEVKVEVTWYPEVKMVPRHPTVVYTIGDELSFTEFIVALRRIVADHPDREDVLDEHPKSSSLSSTTGEHPVLPKQRAEQPARWIHIKLQAKKGEEMMSTTLLMRDDNLYVCGFINQQGELFELIENPNRSADILPVDEYNSRRLSWGVGCRSLLDAVSGLGGILAGANMGRDFAVHAIHVLSHFPAWVDLDVNPSSSIQRMNPRMALAGLIVMVCESARMNRVHNIVTASWWSEDRPYNGMGMTMWGNYVSNYYGWTSRELLTWKSKGYTNPYPMSGLQDIYLALNYRLEPPPQAGGAESSRRTQGTTPQWQPWLAGDGRPRVEVLAMRADIGVIGTTVMVFDGKRGHIIYKDEQGKQGMADLVLTGTCKSISAYGCFAIKIDIPPGAALGSSRKGDFGCSIKWEWDCYDRDYRKEVDKPPVTRTISSSGRGRNVEVTYAVMSKAFEATVQVKMRLRDGNSTGIVYGNITAHIGDWKDDYKEPLEEKDYCKHKEPLEEKDYCKEEIILFKRTEEMGQNFSPTDSRVLQLSRSVIAVPHRLLIKMALHIQTSDNQQRVKPQPVNTTLHFRSGILSRRRHEVNGNEVEVTVTWNPHVSTEELRARIKSDISTEGSRGKMEIDISYMVGGSGEGFSAFITELRRLIADHPGRKDIDVLEEHPDPVLSSTRNHPVLPTTSGLYLSRWLLHIKLHAGSGVETPSITLAMRVDTLDIIGFMNQNGQWYSINGRGLPEEYKARSLSWGQTYQSMLGGRWKTAVSSLSHHGSTQAKAAGSKGLGKTFVDAWRSLLHRGSTQVKAGGDDHSKGLGKTFIADAVSLLSRFDGRTEVMAGGDGHDPAKLALVGLMVMVCESAKFNSVHDEIVRSWEDGTGLTEQLMDYIENWQEMSAALLDWKDHIYQGWPRNERLEKIEIKIPDDALDKVHLVYNDPANRFGTKMLNTCICM